MRNKRENTRKNNNTKNQLFTKKYKTCPFSSKNSPKIDYKNVKLLEKYISEKGKIMPEKNKSSRNSSTTAIRSQETMSQSENLKRFTP